MPPRTPTKWQQRPGSPAKPGAEKLQALLKRGLRYSSKRQFKEALKYLEKVLQIEPNESRALFAKGQLLAEQMYFDRLLFALSYYDELRCDDPVLYYVVGYYYFRLKRYEKALQHLEKAVQLKPSYVIAQLLIAEIFAEVWNGEDSRRILSGLTLKTEKIPKETLSHADVLIKLELYEQALPLLKGLLRHDGMSVQAIRRITRLPKEYWPDWLESELEIHLRRSNTSTEDRMYLHFAAGRVLDSQHAFDKAFYHFEQGNSLSRQDFDADAIHSCVSRLTRIFDNKFEDRRQPSTNKPVLPVFIVGLPSAGKTTLEAQLCQHPDIAGAKERDLRMYIGEDIFVGIDGEAPRNLQSRLLNMSVAKKKQYSQSYIDAVLSSLMLQETPKFLLNTLPLNFWNCGVIKSIFPDARFIHMNRNRMDLCLSNYIRNFNEGYNFSNSFESLSIYWKLYEQMSQHWRHCLGDDWLDVSYELLVSDPTSTIATVFEFLNLPGEDPATICAESSARLTDNYVGRWVNYENHLKPLVEALGVAAGDSEVS